MKYLKNNRFQTKNLARFCFNEKLPMTNEAFAEEINKENNANENIAKWSQKIIDERNSLKGSVSEEEQRTIDKQLLELDQKIDKNHVDFKMFNDSISNILNKYVDNVSSQIGMTKGVDLEGLDSFMGLSVGNKVPDEALKWTKLVKMPKSINSNTKELYRKYLQKKFDEKIKKAETHSDKILNAIGDKVDKEWIDSVLTLDEAKKVSDEMSKITYQDFLETDDYKNSSEAKAKAKFEQQRVKASIASDTLNSKTMINSTINIIDQAIFKNLNRTPKQMNGVANNLYDPVIQLIGRSKITSPKNIRGVKEKNGIKSKGWVEDLQRNYLGFKDSKVDGWLGKNTLKALKKKLTEDGILEK
jgi:hypothetical protein